MAEDEDRARVIGGYQVVRKIGEGGMGAVYEARHVDTGRRAALKVLPPNAATERIVARFRREAEIARTLDHANIVKCLEFGRDEAEGCHYCALELVEGETLSAVIRRRRMLPEGEAVDIARQIARALEHAHSHGLVHRDVKPANIMITPDGTAKLLDLGIAGPVRGGTDPDGDVQDTQDAHDPQGGAPSHPVHPVHPCSCGGPRSKVFVGTARYASPEQARGEREIDIRSDIYSLGATLYHMVTGRPPFVGATSLAILRKHLADRPPPPSEISPHLSDDVCQVIHVMMMKDPGGRHKDPGELLRDLETLGRNGIHRQDAKDAKNGAGLA